METFFALLVICAGNSPVRGEFPAQRPVTRSFDVFFDLRRIKRLNKQSWGWWSETLSRPLWRHSNDCEMIIMLVLITKLSLVIEICWKCFCRHLNFNDQMSSQSLTHHYNYCGMCKIVAWSDHYLPCKDEHVFLQNLDYEIMYSLRGMGPCRQVIIGNDIICAMQTGPCLPSGGISQTSSEQRLSMTPRTFLPMIKATNM